MYSEEVIANIETAYYILSLFWVFCSGMSVGTMCFVIHEARTKIGWTEVILTVVLLISGPVGLKLVYDGLIRGRKDD